MKNTKETTKAPIKKVYVIVPVSVILVLALVVGSVFLFKSCSELKLVEKTEAGLHFAIPEDFVRTYKYDANIEYSGEETAFFVNLIPYSAYELSAGASVKECTEAIIDKMQLGGVAIKYDSEKNRAQFDTWASDEAGSESYYNYIVVIPAENVIYIARYVCAGTEKAIEKYTPDFTEMAQYLELVK